MSRHVWLALYKEPEAAADALDELRARGIDDRDIAVLSGIPYPTRVLGRPMVWEHLPYIAAAGAAVGFLIGVFLNVVTPLLYPIPVGGQPLVAVPPAAVITYEFTMMGLMVSTFLGILWESAVPSFGPKYYHPRITRGRVGVLFTCPPEKSQELVTLLRENGAEDVVNPEG